MAGGDHRLALLLNNAAAEVITAMRYNSRWQVVPRYYEEDRNEPNKYDDAFRNLRSEIFKHTGVLFQMPSSSTALCQVLQPCTASWSALRAHRCEAREGVATLLARARALCHHCPADWSEVDPMTYLTPFLTLIKASDVSGPVTGAAAVALQRILQSDLLCKLWHACTSCEVHARV